MTDNKECNLCNHEFFDYFHGRVYYYCQLKKGHQGNHKHVSTTYWNNKGEIKAK